ncbi:hypothetical protein [Sodalis sp. dw_96]|uniref:hypothetical protein n=1 Tax=Sodalis sp. dw_96 TaxID=2719794 RepID=UPI001BD1E0AE|nr:hypothetical protein [Sodalis sp. dw_96]
MKKSILGMLMIITTNCFANENILFFCTTDEGDSISAQEFGNKLELKINSLIFFSDEDIKQIKERYLKSIKKIPEYNVISFHVKEVEYNLGSFKTTANQAEPSSKLFTFSNKKIPIKEIYCSFGEDNNKFEIWKNEH